MSVPFPAPAAFHPTPDATRILGLDVLRAAAILSVCGAHALAVFYPHSSKIGVLGHGGFYGVELFFVLSGFLIGGILLRLGDNLRTPATVGVFYVRRWFRTLPLFWLFIGLNVWLEWFLHDRHLGAAEILKHAFFVSTFAENKIGFIPESFSLAIEEWFYLLLPAVLWLGLQSRARFRTVLLAAVAAFYLFSTLGRVLSAGQAGASWANVQRVLVIYRFDALMTGVFAAWVAQTFPAAWRRSATFSAIAGFVLTLAMYASLWRPGDGFVVEAGDSFFAQTFRFNLVSLGFALLLPAASRWTLRQETFWSRPVRRIALWSYAMYLVHQPLIHLVQRYGFQNAPKSLLAAIASFATQLALTIAISALIFRFYEFPFTQLREKFSPRVARALGRRATAPAA